MATIELKIGIKHKIKLVLDGPNLNIERDVRNLFPQLKRTTNKIIPNVFRSNKRIELRKPPPEIRLKASIEKHIPNILKNVIVLNDTSFNKFFKNNISILVRKLYTNIKTSPIKFTFPILLPSKNMTNNPNAERNVNNNVFLLNFSFKNMILKKVTIINCNPNSRVVIKETGIYS